jgi:DNA-directed RNA polymerase subunit M/transcription elongation factor TFIIS
MDNFPKLKHVIEEYIHNQTEYNDRKTCAYLYKLQQLIDEKVPTVMNFLKLLLTPHDTVCKIYKDVKYASLNEILISSEIDLCKERFTHIYDLIDKYHTTKNLLPSNYSVLYKCPKCGCNKTHVREFQVRSIDEPTTIFAHCIECGKVWRPKY